MAGKKTTTQKAAGKLVPVITWYNMSYWLVNGLLLKDKAWTALEDLIELGRYEDLGEALREGVRLLLLENADILGNTPHTALGRSKIQIVESIVNLKTPGDMAPDTMGSYHRELLEEMYEKIRKEVD